MIRYGAETETYMRQDIANILSALAETIDDLARRMPSDAVEHYTDGYNAALVAVARAVHVDVYAPRRDSAHNLAESQRRLIDVTQGRAAPKMLSPKGSQRTDG
jgi:hypothetical protein